MSLPGACLQYITQAKVAKLLRRSQFGIGVAAAPETMISICKALGKLNPNHALAALDMINAFGEERYYMK